MAKITADELGAVMVQSSGHRKLLHLWKLGKQRTLCGRYGPDRLAPQDEDASGVPWCGMCKHILAQVGEDQRGMKEWRETP